MADEPDARGPAPLPARQSRARGDLAGPNGTSTTGTGTNGASANGTGANGTGGHLGEPPLHRPRVEEPARVLDMERLRASTESAITVEQENDRRSTPPATERAHRGWMWFALRIAAAAAVISVVMAVTSGGGELTPSTIDTASPAITAADAESSSTVPTTTDPTSADPTTTDPTTADPTTTAPATTPPTTSPTTAPTASAAPEVPPHKAVYRAGKLYLEGSVTSADEAQKYIDKAAAVLGPDNVVNNYTVDPNVPLSNDGTVYVDEPFLFETGSADLNPAYTGVLGLGIAALRLNPNARMVVTGYTDSTGDPARNQELSQERANSVVDYMVTTGGIDRSRFDAIGAGDRDPVGDNSTVEGRRLNRRIDVKLVNLLG